ncbi:MAG: PAS domain-containing protein [candidate division NC10 bacterium]|nr:PAS domain-containing protein [candidate division NC10 bacterium]
MSQPVNEKLSRNEDDLPPLLEMFARAADGVFAIDQAQRIILWNQAAERLLGYRADEVLGRPCYEIFGGRSRTGQLRCSPACSLLTTAKQGKPVETTDLLTRTKTGQTIWITTSVIVVPSKSPDLFTMVHLFRNVTNQVETERLLERIQSLLGQAVWPVEKEPTLPSDLPSPLRSLTPRERDVLRLIAKGETAKEIADTLHISTATARNHTQRILGKLGVHTKLEALALAFRYNLL